MTSDLFAAGDKFEHLPIPDADVQYLPYLDLGRPAQSIMRQLIDTVPWRSESVVLWGKRFVQPRLVAWYGDEGRKYTYSGISLSPLPWTEELLRLKPIVERTSVSQFNSVLLNYYRDHRDSMGFHSDDEIELGDRPTIASLSLGDERTFILKHKFQPKAKLFRLKLASGSLLLMKGVLRKIGSTASIKKYVVAARGLILRSGRLFPLKASCRAEKRSAFRHAACSISADYSRLSPGLSYPSGKHRAWQCWPELFLGYR